MSQSMALLRGPDQRPEIIEHAKQLIRQAKEVRAAMDRVRAEFERERAAEVLRLQREAGRGAPHNG